MHSNLKLILKKPFNGKHLNISEAKKTLLILYLPTVKKMGSNQPLGKASIALM